MLNMYILKPFHLHRKRKLINRMIEDGDIVEVEFTDDYGDKIVYSIEYEEYICLSK